MSSAAEYPRPDRSKRKPNFSRELGSVIDLAWGEGLLSDGRPFRAEAWCEDQMTFITYFFSTRGLEDKDRHDLAGYLVREGLVEFKGEKKYISAGKIRDYSGHEMWSVTIIIGDEDETFATDKFPLQPYPQRT